MMKHLIWRIGMVSLKRSQVVTTQKTQLVEVNIGFRQRRSSLLVVSGEKSVEAIRHLEGSAHPPGDDGQVVRRISHTAVLPVDHGEGPIPTVVWTERDKTSAELHAEQDAADLEEKRGNYQGAVSTLRTWSEQAEGMTVTSGNAVATLQQLVDRQAVFYDRFADLIEAEHSS